MVYCKSAACTGVCRRVPACAGVCRLCAVAIAIVSPWLRSALCRMDGAVGRPGGPGMIAARVTIGHRVAVCDEGTVAQFRTQVRAQVGHRWKGTCGRGECATR